MHPLTFPRAGAVGLALTLVVGFPAAVTADTGTSESPRPPGLLLALDGDELTLDLTDTEREPSPQETPAEPVPVEVNPATLGTDTVWLSGLSAEDADPERAVSATSGVDTTGVDGALDDSVRITLTEVDGPGAVGLYTDGLAPLLVVEGTGPATAVLPEGEVTEAAWGFAEPGEYTLTFHAATTLPDGGEAVTERTHRLTASPMAAPLPGAPLPQTPERPAVPGPPAQPDEEMSSPRGGTAPQQNTAARPLAADDEPAVGGQTVTLSDGHVDVAGRIIDGDMELSVKDGTRSGATTWRTPDSVVVQVAADARQEWPSGAAYDFLADPGSDVWMIPQVQRQGVIWAGWNTEEIGADQVDGQVTWTLRDVRGPGDFALFSTTSFGTPEVLFDGADTPGSFDVPLGTHAHGNWAFSATGSYELDLEMSATSAGGERVSDTGTLQVTVVSAGGGGGSNGNGGGGSGNGSGDGGAGGGAGTGGGGSGGGGTGGGGSGADGRLPRTGADLVPFVVAAALLTLLGGTAILMARPRRRPAAPAL